MPVAPDWRDWYSHTATESAMRVSASGGTAGPNTPVTLTMSRPA